MPQLPVQSSPECQMIYLGGTILMKASDEGFVPHYTPEHIGAYHRIMQEDLPEVDKKALVQTLLDSAPGQFSDIQAQLKDRGTQEAFAQQSLQSIGYANYKRLRFDPIDSINFDVESHYKELFHSTVATINEGKLPVILGGTDSLRFYGTLLAEDLKSHGITTPVVIASSMRAFGSAEEGSQEHVLQLFKAARVAAATMHNQGKSGVYALVAEDLAVSCAELLSLNEPLDKISGTLVKAFVGTGVANVTPDADVTPTPYTEPRIAHDGSTHYNRLVLPPVEAYSQSRALNAYLGAVVRRTEQDVDAVVIKGLPHRMRDAVADHFIALVQALGDKGVNVYIVNDLEANLQQDATKLTPIQIHFASHPLRMRAEQAGAICQEGISSTQSYIRAAMSPVRQGRTQAAVEMENSAASHLKMPPLSMEYVPDRKAYLLGLELAQQAGIKEIISVNFTHGTMAGSYAKDLEKFEDMNITLTFKYASKDMGAGQENADLDGYAASKDLRGQSHVFAGKQKSPQVLAAPLVEKMLAQRVLAHRTGVEPPLVLGR